MGRKIRLMEETAYLGILVAGIVGTAIIGALVISAMISLPAIAIG